MTGASMKRRNRFVRVGMITLLAAGSIAAVFALGGGSAFSPGPLNAETRAGAKLGGVSSHAELGGRCSACHGAPWSSTPMAARCLNCHTDVRQEIDAHRSMHGNLSDGMRCRECH